MWQRNAILLTAGLWLVPRSESLGQNHDGSGRLLGATQWVTCEVSLGRLLATSQRTKQGQPRTARVRPDGSEESLSVRLDGGLVSLLYTCVGPAEKLTIRIVRRDEVDIECRRGQPGDPATIVRFCQLPTEPVVLSVQQGTRAADVYAAPSLWHLLLEHPQVCRQHLYAPLQMLRPDWQLDQELAEIRSQMLAGEAARVPVSRHEVEQLVAQLAFDQFPTRQRAARELRRCGHAALGYLDELDPQQLDREQRLRVHSVREAIVSHATDSPARVAAWLVNDKAAWHALLQDEQESLRLAADTQLARLEAGRQSHHQRSRGNGP
jgi:hypothetical protein